MTAATILVLLVALSGLIFGAFLATLWLKWQEQKRRSVQKLLSVPAAHQMIIEEVPSAAIPILIILA